MQDFNESKHGYAKEEVEGYIKQVEFSYEKKLDEQKERIFALLENVKRTERELNEYKRKDEQISMALVGAVQKAKEIEETAQKRYDIEIQRLKLFHNKWVKYYKYMREKMPVDDEFLSVEEFLLEMNFILELDEDEEFDIPRYIKPQPVVSFNEEVNKEAFEATFTKEKERIARGLSKFVPANYVSQREKQPIQNGNVNQLRRNIVASTMLEKFNTTFGKSEASPMARIGAYISSSVTATPNISDSGFDLSEVLNPGTKLDLADLCKDLGLMEDF